MGPTQQAMKDLSDLTFYDPDLANSNEIDDLEIRAREFTSGQSWNTTGDWTEVAGGLSYDTWYEIRLDVDVAGGTYNVYVDGLLEGNAIESYGGYSSSSVTHLSFSTGTQAQGDFYVDKVQEAGEMQCFSTTGTYTFSTQSGVEIEVTDLGPELGCLYVDEVPANHPNATGSEGDSGIMTGRYWTIHGLQSDGSTPATDYILNLTLPHNISPDTNAYVCKYPGTQGGFGWNCGRTGSDAGTVWLTGITSLSDWAVGDDVGPTAIRLQNLTASSGSLSDNLLTLTGLTLLGLALVSSLGLLRFRKHRLKD